MSFITPSFPSNPITPSSSPLREGERAVTFSFGPMAGTPFSVFPLTWFPHPLPGNYKWGVSSDKAPQYQICDADQVGGCPGNLIPRPILGISWPPCTVQGSCREPKSKGCQSSWAEGRCDAWLPVVRPWMYITP